MTTDDSSASSLNTSQTTRDPRTDELPILTDINEMSVEEKKVVRKSVAGSAMGNAIEWFDYGIYGYLTIYISQLFFGDGPYAIAATFATLAVSFLFRPLGGFILGPLGDKIGRQKVLVFTILMITAATACIGILPTMDTVGVLAPILLLLLRIVQGFSAGGEYGGAAVFMAEHAPDNRRGFFGSFLEFGTLAGTCAAAILCTALTAIVGEEGMLAGWWRLPFLLTIPLGLIALYLRSSLHESDVFTEAAASEKTEKKATGALIDLIKGYWRQLLILMGFVTLLNIAFYLVLTYLPTYLAETLGHDVVQSNLTLVGIMLVMMIVISPIGRLSDRVGRKPLLLTASIGYVVLSVPAFLLIQQDNVFLQTVGMAILGLLLVILVASVSSTLPALFPTQVRYSGFAIGYNVATALFAGTSASIVAGLIEITGSKLIPGWYLVAAGVIGTIAILCMRETAGRSLRGDKCPGEDDEIRALTGVEPIGYKG
ncbi:MFS transporter [Saxibacter everestensis]|uniref:MFS transporter n=1 Tax=Saxibacter everestensis TaxID=2909229 RepID=A0ABY8QQV4_9MICO|nr:MFS transporter [Brevibacteriaceae bacterium ZFBP1038]